MTNYPEHEKLSAVKDEANMIGEFLEWLTIDYKIAKFNQNDELILANDSIEQYLARYFKIDLKKIDEEKDQMLKAIRQEDTKNGK